jgi:hypothetical protein
MATPAAHWTGQRENNLEVIAGNFTGSAAAPLGERLRPAALPGALTGGEEFRRKMGILIRKISPDLMALL